MTLTAFTIKCIAVAAMLIDHVQVVFPEVFPVWFRVVGRLAFPLFAFLLAEGFRHTRNRGWFLLRLGVFAFISEPFFDLAMRGGLGTQATINFLTETNIFYTLFLGGAAIVVYDWARRRLKGAGWLELAVCGVFALAAHVLSTDFGWQGVVFIFALYVADELRRHMVMAAMCMVLWLPAILHVIGGGALAYPMLTLAFILATLCTVPIAARYNGKRGHDRPAYKWLFYAFYPLHLAVLAALLWLS